MADQNRYDSGLPWGAERGENSRFNIALVAMFVMFLPPALLIPSLELPEPERSEAEKIPPQLARLIEQKQPPEPEVKAQPEPAPEPEPEPEPEEQKPAEPKPQEIAAQPEPKPEPAKPEPQQTVEKAREKASRSGLMAMKDTLASMRSPEPTATKTLSANVDSSDLKSPDATDTSATKALSGSGGVEREQGLTRDVAVADHQVRSVEVAEEPTVAAAPEPSTGSGSSTRSMSNIRQVFDANKTALNALYRREQRKDPTLQGRVTLKLVIEPDGSVSSCEVVESELDHSKLEQRIALRVRLFNFGSADVEQRELTFPLDFLPG